MLQVSPSLGAGLASMAGSTSRPRGSISAVSSSRASTTATTATATTTRRPSASRQSQAVRAHQLQQQQRQLQQQQRRPVVGRKTFTGCWTCRSRKRKCDETYPHCNQCTKKNLVCEGYSTRLQWLPCEVGPSDGTPAPVRTVSSQRRQISFSIPSAVFDDAELDRLLLDVDEDTAPSAGHTKLRGPFGVFPATHVGGSRGRGSSALTMPATATVAQHGGGHHGGGHHGASPHDSLCLDDNGLFSPSIAFTQAVEQQQQQQSRQPHPQHHPFFTLPVVAPGDLDAFGGGGGPEPDDPSVAMPWNSLDDMWAGLTLGSMLLQQQQNQQQQQQQQNHQQQSPGSTPQSLSAQLNLFGMLEHDSSTAVPAATVGPNGGQQQQQQHAVHELHDDDDDDMDDLVGVDGQRHNSLRSDGGASADSSNMNDEDDMMTDLLMDTHPVYSSSSRRRPAQTSPSTAASNAVAAAASERPAPAAQTPARAAAAAGPAPPSPPSAPAPPASPSSALAMSAALLLPPPERPMAPAFFLQPKMRFLLSHYVQHVVNSFCISTRTTRSPWKSIHLPRALQGSGELAVMGATSHARSALLNALLAVSAYCLANRYDAARRLDEVARWRKVGSQLRLQVLSSLRHGLADSLAASNECLGASSSTSTSSASSSTSSALTTTTTAYDLYDSPDDSFFGLGGHPDGLSGLPGLPTPPDALQDPFAHSLAAATSSGGRPKYKELLAAMLSMVSVDVASGDTVTTRTHLLGCESLIRSAQSWKRHYSAKARSLHRIFYYLRVIYASTNLVDTFDEDCLPEEAAAEATGDGGRSCGSGAATALAAAAAAAAEGLPDAAAASRRGSGRATKSGRAATLSASSSKTATTPASASNNAAKTRPAAGGTAPAPPTAATRPCAPGACKSTRAWLEETLLESSETAASVEFIYGVPASLLILLARVTDHVRRLGRLGGRCPTRDAAVSPHEAALAAESDRLEAEILTFPVDALLAEDDARMGCGGSGSGADGDARQRAPLLEDRAIVHHQTRAFHQAVVLYFCQNIRAMHSLHLRPYVEAVLVHAEAIETIKRRYGVASGTLYWPCFVAASEAVDPSLQQRFLHWYETTYGAGFAGCLRGRDIVAEVWRRRRAGWPRERSNWRAVVESQNACLMLT